MHISILVPRGEAVVSSVVGTFKVFTSINEYLQMTGQHSGDFYEVDLVGLDDQALYYDGLFQINPNKRVNEIPRTDLVVVTTIKGDFKESIRLNDQFIPWIRHQYLQIGAEVASLCGGAFLLAATGLLNGRTASTHWIAQQEFREMFPQVKLLPEKIISEEAGIYTSGGAYSFLNLLLHLIGKYNGRETAVWCSKLFEIEFDRTDQQQFIVFQGQKDHQDESIKSAQEYIEQNVAEKISIGELASRVAISRRNFVRRFKNATSNTPLEYVQRVKIEAAKNQLESSTKNISEVMFEVGYNDDKAFRNIFRKLTGLTPYEYRMKYNREIALASINDYFKSA